MHVQNCLHPLKIRDQYTGEERLVPCGQCEACLSARSRSLMQRLDAEKQSWKHCTFFTLTYSPVHRPILKVLDSSGYLTDNTPKRVHPILGSMLFNRFDEYEKLRNISRYDIEESEKFVKTCLDQYGGVPYVCSLDVQRFMKRLRVNIERTFKKEHIKNKNDIDYEKVPKVRYFICSEYGPTTFLPHLHGVLFYSSDWLVQNIHKFISDSWQLGITDSSYVYGKAIGYVSKYCNSFSHLPAVLRCSSIRPFCLYSKHPAIGTLMANSSVQKEMFLKKELYQVLVQSGQSVVVPLLRALQDKLYPRLTAFSKFSANDLRILYTIPSDFETFPQFRKYILNNNNYSVVLTYLSLLRETVKGEFDNKLFRWYSISRRVAFQSESWNMSIRSYVANIVDYYKLVDYEKLSKWYEFSEKYVEEHDVRDLFCFDSLFAKHLLTSAYEIGDLDATELYYLKSYGIDLGKWFSLDYGERQLYRSKFSLESSDEYLSYKAETLFYYDKSTKTKRKNDYLQSHPDLLKAFGWITYKY